MLVSLAVVSIWLVPLLTQASDNFAVSLLWKQTAGRISGNMGASHARPFYFYFMVLPIFILPWALFPAVWRGIKSTDHSDPSVRFLITATLPAFVCFCLISGKQPHYILPLFPFMAVWASALLHDHGKAVIHTACALIVLGLGVQEPMTSWGVLISVGAKNIGTANWLLLFPAFFLVSTLFALNFVGDGLRDALDPRDR